MRRTMLYIFRAVAIVLGAAVVALSFGALLVHFGVVMSPIAEVWVYVGAEGSFDLVRGARLYIDGSLVGTGRQRGESFRLLVWRYGVAQVKVVKAGFATWSDAVDWRRLRRIEEGHGYLAGPFELSVTLKPLTDARSRSRARPPVTVAPPRAHTTRSTTPPPDL